jgi:hypothetical protein
MIILYGLDFWTTISPLLTPRWQQGMASLKRLLKKSGRKLSMKSGMKSGAPT